MDLATFYSRFIELADRILPALPPAEQIVFMQLFARTVAVDSQTCRLSYADLTHLTRLSIPTIKSALKNLMHKGCVRIVQIGSARQASSYEILWPQDIRQSSRLQREPSLLLKEMQVSGYVYDSLIDRLDAEDANLLDVTLSTIPAYREARLRKQAADHLRPGEDLEKKYRELVVLNSFGPMRLRKYATEG